MLGVWADFTHLPDRKTLPHFIIYKARGEKIITLGRGQIKAQKVDYQSDGQRQLVDRSTPAAGHSLPDLETSKNA